MTYIPKTEEQLAQETLLPEGEYDFEVIETSDKPSKKGNDMFALKLHVFDNDGGSQNIFDYMVMGNTFGERKLRHAADACGLIDIYNSGNLKANDFFGACGRAKVKQQPGTSEYPAPKNVISDYLARDESAVEKPVNTRLERALGKFSDQDTPTRDLIDDDLPF